MQTVYKELDELRASVAAIPSVDASSYEYSIKVIDTVKRQLSVQLKRNNGQPMVHKNGNSVSIWSQYGQRIANAVQNALTLNGDDDPHKKTAVAKQNVQKDIQRFRATFESQQGQGEDYEYS